MTSASSAPQSSSSTPASPSPQPSFLRKNGAKLVASAVITVSIILALKKGGLKFTPEAGTLDHVRWWTVPLYVLSLGIMSYFRAVRWRFLLRSFADIPRGRILAVSWIGFAAILIMPFRLGELVRPYMIRKSEGKKGRKVSLSAATGTVVAERVVDGLFLSTILAIALILVPHVEPLPDQVVGLPVSVASVRHAGFVMLGVFLIAFVTIAVFYFARDLARRLTLSVFGLVSKTLGEKLAGIAENLAEGLHFLGRWGDAWPFFAETAIYWFFNVLGMWILAYGCGVVHQDGTIVTIGESAALMGMLGITILIPGPPGMLGVFQLGIYAGMTMYFPTNVVTTAGSAYVFMLYAIQLVWTLGSGGICLFADRGNLKALEEAEGILPPETSGQAPAAKA